MDRSSHFGVVTLPRVSVLIRVISEESSQIHTYGDGMKLSMVRTVVCDAAFACKITHQLELRSHCKCRTILQLLQIGVT